MTIIHIVHSIYLMPHNPREMQNVFNEHANAIMTPKSFSVVYCCNERGGELWVVSRRSSWWVHCSFPIKALASHCHVGIWLSKYVDLEPFNKRSALYIMCNLQHYSNTILIWGSQPMRSTEWHVFCICATLFHCTLSIWWLHASRTLRVEIESRTASIHPIEQFIVTSL